MAVLVDDADVAPSDSDEDCTLSDGTDAAQSDKDCALTEVFCGTDLNCIFADGSD